MAFHTSLRSALVAGALALSTGIAVPVLAASTLPALNIDIEQTSVSGISSGGFMTVQMHATHADQIVGIGVFAGGPYQCSGTGNSLVGINNALNVCLAGEADADISLQRLQSAFADGKVADPAEQYADKVWLFGGYNDGVVKQNTMNELFEYYEQLTAEGNTHYRDNLNAGHAQITLEYGQECKTHGDNFINDCDYDGAGLLLQHIYGELNPRATSYPEANLIAVNQGDFVVNPTLASMAETAYLYIPSNCASGSSTTCRLHIAFHGCLQNAEAIGDDFYRHAGYNEWAEANDIVVLYPQTKKSSAIPFNPKGCWDWWGYSDPNSLSADYASIDSIQIQSIWNMVEQLSSGFQGTPVSLPAADNQLNLIVADSSDDAIELYWQASESASYQLYRTAGTGQPTEQVSATPITGSSYSDSGLTINSSYRYQLVELQPGGNQITSAVVNATTGNSIPECDPWFGTAEEHLLNGRATWWWGFVVALGSGDTLANYFNYKTEIANLQKTGPLYYEVGDCPAN